MSADLRRLIGRIRMHPESSDWERVADQLDAYADDEPAQTRLGTTLVRALTMALDARDAWKKELVSVRAERRALIVQAVELGEQNRWDPEEVADRLLGSP